MNSARRVDFDPLSRDFGSCESFFLTNIYQLLCNEQSAGWYIPTTVVYSTSTATLFQSDSDGRVTIVQPKIHQKVSDVILQAFLEADFTSALQSVSSRENDSKSQDALAVVAVIVRMFPTATGNNSLKIQYLNQQQLIRYICLEKKESGAILQQFIQPSGSNHSVIRTWFTPALCSHEICSSTISWFDTKNPVNLRFCDFDGNQQFMRIDSPHSNVAHSLSCTTRKLVKGASSCLRKNSAISCIAAYYQWKHGRPCFLYCGGAQVQVNAGRGDGSSRFGPYVPSTMSNAGVVQKMQSCVLCKTPLPSCSRDILPVSVRDLVFFFKKSTQPPLRWQVPAFAAFSQCFALDDKTAIDLESILAAPKFQELAVCVCSSCSLKISDKKFLAFSAGEMPIPGASQRSLGYGNSCPAPDSSLQSPAATARIQLSQRDNAVDIPRVDRLDSANDTKSPQVHPKVPNAAGCKAENFAFVCAWKEFPDIQRLFAACAASAVEGFQMQFQPLRLRDAEVTLGQWMLLCRECSIGFHLNLSNSELRQSFCDARCGLRDNTQLPQNVIPRIALDLPQFTQSLVFVAARAGLIYPFDWKVQIECPVLLNSSQPLWQLPPQELRAFANSDKALLVAPPIKTEVKLDKKPSFLERRVIIPSRAEEAPNLSHIKLIDKKQAVEACEPPAIGFPQHPPAVPPLNMSKLTNLNREVTAQEPSIGLLASHRAQPPTAFLSICSEKQNVSFCMPRGMNRQSQSRRVQLLMPSPPKHHPIFTSRRLLRTEEQ